MMPVGLKLKELREQANPRPSIRAMGAALGIPFASYAFYERDTYKKPFLPVEFARKVAAVLAERGIDPAEVMKLAGFNGDEVEPEARAIEAARPGMFMVSLQVALPSEAALSDMFESLLALVPPDATRAEAARILAQRLPSGFAAIGPATIEPGTIVAPAAGAAAQSPATDHREPARR